MKSKVVAIYCLISLTVGVILTLVGGAIFLPPERLEAIGKPPVFNGNLKTRLMVVSVYANVGITYPPSYGIILQKNQSLFIRILHEVYTSDPLNTIAEAAAVVSYVEAE